MNRRKLKKYHKKDIKHDIAIINIYKKTYVNYTPDMNDVNLLYKLKTIKLYCIMNDYRIFLKREPIYRVKNMKNYI